MWIGNPIRYKYYSELEKLMACFIEDYHNWNPEQNLGKFGIEPMATFNFHKNLLGNVNIDTSNIDDVGIKSFALIHKSMKFADDLYANWETAIEQAHRCPGMEYVYVNTLAPHSITPPHDDEFLWRTVEVGSNKQITDGVSISFGIDIPVPEKQALLFDGVEYVYGTGEFVGFNGRNVVHSVNNDTDKWRVSGIMLISGDHWN